MLAHHQAREEARSLEAAREVVGVEGDDAAHALAEIDGRRERECRAHRLTGEREVGEVEVLDQPDDRCSQGRFLVVGAGDDVRPAHAREVDRVHRERVRELWDDELEVVELRADRVHQEQRWPAADAQVTDARAAAQHDMANLPVFAPPLRVSVLRVLARRVQIAEFVLRRRDHLAVETGLGGGDSRRGQPHTRP